MAGRKFNVCADADTITLHANDLSYSSATTGTHERPTRVCKVKTIKNKTNKTIFRDENFSAEGFGGRKMFFTTLGCVNKV